MWVCRLSAKGMHTLERRVGGLQTIFRQEEPGLERLVKSMQGGPHCRPAWIAKAVDWWPRVGRKSRPLLNDCEAVGRWSRDQTSHTAKDSGFTISHDLWYEMWLGEV